MWERMFISTSRGKFEIYTQGKGEPVCITHLYSEFNELGYYFADTFVSQFKIYLINLKEAGNSFKAGIHVPYLEEKEKFLQMVSDFKGLTTRTYS